MRFKFECLRVCPSVHLSDMLSGVYNARGALTHNHILPYAIKVGLRKAGLLAFVWEV